MGVLFALIRNSHTTYRHLADTSSKAVIDLNEQHRSERDEWRGESIQRQQQSDLVLRELTSAIHVANSRASIQVNTGNSVGTQAQKGDNAHVGKHLQPNQS